MALPHSRSNLAEDNHALILLLCSQLRAVSMCVQPGNLVPSWSWDDGLKTSYASLELKGAMNPQDIMRLRAVLYSHPDFVKVSTPGNGNDAHKAWQLMNAHVKHTA